MRNLIIVRQGKDCSCLTSSGYTSVASASCTCTVPSAITDFCIQASMPSSVSSVLLFTGHCYIKINGDSTQNRNWNTAFDYCASFPGIPSGYRGRLAHVDTSGILSALGSPSVSSWLGLKVNGLGYPSTGWTGLSWYDGTSAASAVPVQCVSIGSTVTGARDSIASGGGPGCVSIDSSGVWRGSSCSTVERPICHIQRRVHCLALLLMEFCIRVGISDFRLEWAVQLFNKVVSK